MSAVCFGRPIMRFVMENKYAAGLDRRDKFHYNSEVIGVWRSLVSRLVRVQEASGSNPDTPTKK